jgi:hypothetical protein
MIREMKQNGLFTEEMEAATRKLNRFKKGVNLMPFVIKLIKEINTN